MLTIDDIHTCFTAFFKGHDDIEKNWSISAKYDTSASTRIPVYGMTFYNKSNPLIPAFSEIKVAEGWELRGGMEHGTMNIEASIWTSEHNHGTTNFSYIENKDKLLGYLRTHIPLGEHHVAQIQASNLVLATQKRMAEEAALNAKKVDECVRDEDIQLLLNTIVTNAVSSGLSTSTYPQLKQQIALTLNRRIEKLPAADFDTEFYLKKHIEK